MSDPDSQAARLHQMLDEIIRAKTKLKVSDDKLDTAEGQQELSYDALQIFSDAADLLAKLVDDHVSEIAFGPFPETDDPEKFRWIAIDKLVEKLSYFEQILGAPNWSWWVSNLLDELAFLRSGDETNLLTPAKRKRGQGKRPGRVAYLRCQALQWLEYMRTHGIKRKERHDLVGDAYGPDSDSIRKWRGLCENVLGKQNIDRRIAAAAQRGWAPDSYLTVDEKGKPTLSERGKDALRENGDTYREFFKVDRLGNT